MICRALTVRMRLGDRACHLELVVVLMPVPFAIVGYRFTTQRYFNDAL